MAPRTAIGRVQRTCAVVYVRTLEPVFVTIKVSDREHMLVLSDCDTSPHCAVGRGMKSLDHSFFLSGVCVGGPPPLSRRLAAHTRVRASLDNEPSRLAHASIFCVRQPRTRRARRRLRRMLVSCDDSGKAVPVELEVRAPRRMLPQQTARL